LASKAFAPQGVTVEQVSLDRGNLGGVFITGSQTAYGHVFKKLVYIFPAGTKTGQLVSNLPANLEDDANASIAACMLDAKFSEITEADQFAGLNFSFENRTKMKFVQRLTNLLLYSPGGTVPSDESFQIGSSVGTSEIADKKEFVLNRLKTLPGSEDLEVGEVKDIAIDGMSGFEVTGKNRSTGKLTYLGIVFEKDNYFIANATSTRVDTLDQARSSFYSLRRR
ncbi:MAG: hypothetical protein KDD42_10305, partial [Bdellovibrionales bacterium]|nr:hypothetical protein [Bdellovibrionales bacterium]